MTATAMRLPTGEAVSFRQLEEDLARQLKALRGPGEAPVARARMSNFVIYCDDSEQAATLQAILPTVVAAHPARVLLLIGEPAAVDEELTATAHVWSHAPSSRQPIYTEQITLHARGESIERLPFLVRGLLVGDLPTNLWWTGEQPPPLAGSVFFDLAEPAQQVVYDSDGWTDAGDGFAAIGLWLAQFEQAPGQVLWRSAADLNWRRGKHWRRLIGQAFDPAVLPGALPSIREVLIEHGPTGAASAWLLAAWLAAGLDWQPRSALVSSIETTWRMTTAKDRLRVRLRPKSNDPAGLHCVRIACTLHGKEGAVNVVQIEPRRLAVVPEGIAAVPHTISLRPQPLADLVGRQLSDRERDPIFDQTVAAAQAMAECARAG